MFFAAPVYYWSLTRKPDVVVDACNTLFFQSPLWAWRSLKIAYFNCIARSIFSYEASRIVALIGGTLERLQFLFYRRTPFVCYGEGIRRELIALGVPDRRIHLFPLGIDHGRYRPAERSETPLFVCVNRLILSKRTHLAVEAMAVVRRTHPEAKLVVVGYGYERERLEALRDALDIRDNVSFLDDDILFLYNSERDRKVTMMQRAWSLVFASVKEGNPLTIVECASCGTPAIVADVSGLREAVVHEQTGLIVPPDPTPEEVAAAMVQMIEDRDLRERLWRNALEAASTLSWEESTTQFARIVEEQWLTRRAG
jgi:glycosyltransferase involved in cell wall biosynthesis